MKEGTCPKVAPFAYPGGKGRLASKIVTLLPPHSVYVEPFCGASSVFFAKGVPAVSNLQEYREVLNDRDLKIYSFFKSLRDDSDELVRRLSLTLYSREDHRRAKESTPSTDLERAVEFFVSSQQSFGKTYRDSWGFSKKSPHDVAAYASKVDRMSRYVSRLRGVYIENDDVLSVIKRWDSPSTLFYLDPPYPSTTQKYCITYTQEDFEDLIKTLEGIAGSFVLSCTDNAAVPNAWPFVDLAVTRSISKNHRSKLSEKLWIVDRSATIQAPAPKRPDLRTIATRNKKLLDAGKVEQFETFPMFDNIFRSDDVRSDD